MKRISNKDIVNAYRSVREFNDCSGQLEGDFQAHLDLALSLCYEETLEAIESFEAGDKANFLKEVCDVLVTTFGLLQKAEAAGYNVAGAMRLVNENNLSKMPSADFEIHYDSNKYKAVKNLKYKRWVLKDANNKTGKPANYKKLDLSYFIPKH